MMAKVNTKINKKIIFFNSFQIIGAIPTGAILYNHLLITLLWFNYSFAAFRRRTAQFSINSATAGAQS